MTRWPALALAVLGLAQMAGDVFHLPALKGIAAATGASPAPKVFSAVRGFETYSTRFDVEWTDRSGQSRSMVLSPELNARLRGPYNRRNVFGAVLAYGPILATDARTRPMFDSVARYALCGEAPILRELGIDPETISGHVTLRLTPREGIRAEGLPLKIDPGCP